MADKNCVKLFRTDRDLENFVKKDKTKRDLATKLGALVQKFWEAQSEMDEVQKKYVYYFEFFIDDRLITETSLMSIKDFLERYKDNKDMDEPVSEQNEKEVFLDLPMENRFYFGFQTENDQFDLDFEKTQKKMLTDHKLKEKPKPQLIPDIAQSKTIWINKVLLSQTFAKLYEYSDLLINKLMLRINLFLLQFDQDCCCFGSWIQPSQNPWGANRNPIPGLFCVKATFKPLLFFSIC